MTQSSPFQTVGQLSEAVLEVCETIVAKGLNSKPEREGVAVGEVDAVVRQLKTDDLQRVRDESENTVARMGLALVEKWQDYQAIGNDKPQQQQEARQGMIELAEKMRKEGWDTPARPFEGGTSYDFLPRPRLG